MPRNASPTEDELTRGRFVRALVGIGGISGAILMIELALTRIYSVTMYYHFAFLAISIALLGLATAGTTIYLLPKVFTPARTAKLAALFMIGFGLTTAWAVAAAIHSPI